MRWRGPTAIVNNKPILSSEGLLHKDYNGKCSVEKIILAVSLRGLACGVYEVSINPVVQSIPRLIVTNLIRDNRILFRMPWKTVDYASSEKIYYIYFNYFESRRESPLNINIVSLFSATFL
jgi:hypothetical protein